ncbi:MAG: FmdB family zinc ribbon protein [Gammaproteobacteria bacterium]
MPIYEYRCNHCGHRFERLQKMSDPDPERCPDCAAEGEVTRLISAVGFRLKGGGWYETDFKKDKRHNVAESGNEEKKKTEPESEKGAAKPSEKQDSKSAVTEKKKPASKAKPGSKASA